MPQNDTPTAPSLEATVEWLTATVNAQAETLSDLRTDIDTLRERVENIPDVQIIADNLATLGAHVQELSQRPGGDISREEFDALAEKINSAYVRIFGGGANG